MTRVKDSQRREKENLIFEAALRVIKRNGFHRARMSDIAREAGISYGLVYHYYGNKENLFDAILEIWWDGLFRLMEEIRAGREDFAGKLRRLVDYFLDSYHAHPELMNIFITEISRSTTNLTARRLEQFRGFMSLTESLLREGQRAGVLRSDFKARYLNYIFLGALEAFISVMVLADQSISGDEQKARMAETILEVFLNGARRQQPVSA